MTAVEILTIFLEMHRDKMSDTGHKQHKASYKEGRNLYHKG